MEKNKIIFYGTIALILLSLIPIFIDTDTSLIKPIKDKFEFGTFGDYIGGILGTIIATATLWVVYRSFKQVNEQSLQQSIAILQSYQHTVEDYDFTDCFNAEKVESGREGIKMFLNNKIKEEVKQIKSSENFINNAESPLRKTLIEDFPTHIPAIIVSIMITIKSSDVSESKKKDLSKFIETMLSYEERILLLLYLFEKKLFDDYEYETEGKLVFELLDIKENKLKPYFEDYKALIGLLKIKLPQQDKPDKNK